MFHASSFTAAKKSTPARSANLQMASLPPNGADSFDSGRTAPAGDQYGKGNGSTRSVDNGGNGGSAIG